MRDDVRALAANRHDEPAVAQYLHRFPDRLPRDAKLLHHLWFGRDRTVGRIHAIGDPGRDQVRYLHIYRRGGLAIDHSPTVGDHSWVGCGISVSA